MAYWRLFDFPFPNQNSELRSVAAVESVHIPIQVFRYHPGVFASGIQDRFAGKIPPSIRVAGATPRDEMIGCEPAKIVRAPFRARPLASQTRFSCHRICSCCKAHRPKRGWVMVQIAVF